LAEGSAFRNRLDGEFAFVVAQKDGRLLTAQRDAFGVKPLFFFLQGVDTASFAEARAEYRFHTSLIAFGSEIKALAAPRVWNRDGALRQFTGLFEPVRTPFSNIIALPAGATFEARLVSPGLRHEATYECTLRLDETPVRDSPHGRFLFSERELAAEFRHAFRNSVTDRLLSDVELGVYLSGGVDSKAVGYELARHLAAVKGKERHKPLKSFTIGFESPAAETSAYDETTEALAFAHAHGFHPHTLSVSDDCLAYSYPIAVEHSENLQPYTNGAAKWWLSRFTREHVHGVLTGDGADELLCGYPSFRYCAWWKFANRGATHVGQNPRPLGATWRDALYAKRFHSDASNPWVAGSSSAGHGDDFLSSLALWGVAHPLFGQVRTITRALFPSTPRGIAEADAWLAAQGPSVKSWFLFGHQGAYDAADPQNVLFLWQNYFCKTHLPVQVLNWVGDRMEMANTLEGRTPFLSKRLRDFTRGLGDAALVSGFTDKAILRAAYVPSLGSFARTPKKQFGAPFLNNKALLKAYPPHAALGALGLDADPLLARLDSVKSSTLPAFEATHLASALQTCVALGIVSRTLVEERPVERNAAFEARTLARTRV
jgi:asparagine synthase (glutamine-hydrolysing)